MVNNLLYSLLFHRRNLFKIEAVLKERAHAKKNKETIATKLYFTPELKKKGLKSL